MQYHAKALHNKLHTLSVPVSLEKLENSPSSKMEEKYSSGVGVGGLEEQLYGM